MSVDFELLERADGLIKQAHAFQIELIPSDDLIDDDALILVILNDMPFFNSLLKRLSSTSSAISKLLKKTGDSPNYVLNAVNVSPFIAISLNVLDFIQIPLLYLTAFALGKKPPITLSNNARWLYAGVLLSLCLSAFMIPSAAPFIAIVSAVLGFAASTFTLGKLLHGYHQDKKELENIMHEINNGPNAQMLKCIAELETACKTPDIDSATIQQLITKIERLQKDCDAQKDILKTQHKEVLILQEKLRIESSFLDGCMGMVLSSLAVSGTLVSLFFPPAGLIILITATLAGTAYVIARLTIPYFMAFSDESRIQEPNKHSPSDASQKPSHTDSTSLLFKRFGLTEENTPSQCHEKECTTPLVEKKEPPSNVTEQTTEQNAHQPLNH